MIVTNYPDHRQMQMEMETENSPQSLTAKAISGQALPNAAQHSTHAYH